MSERDLADPSADRYRYAAARVQTAIPNAKDKSVDYADRQLREKSFDLHWPEGFKPSIAEMVDAGFVFVGPGDFVECYSCGIKLHLWSKENNPKYEHENYQKQKKIRCCLYPEITATDF